MVANFGGSICYILPVKSSGNGVQVKLGGHMEARNTNTNSLKENKQLRSAGDIYSHPDIIQNPKDLSQLIEIPVNSVVTNLGDVILVLQKSKVETDFERVKSHVVLKKENLLPWIGLTLSLLIPAFTMSETETFWGEPISNFKYAFFAASIFLGAKTYKIYRNNERKSNITSVSELFDALMKSLTSNQISIQSKKED